MKSHWLCCAALLFSTSPAFAKKKASAAPVKQASAQTAKAIGDLAGKFKWGMSHDEVAKLLADEIVEKYDERIKKETIPAKQQTALKARDEEMKRVTDGYVKFEGNKTGWDVSIADREFVHKNDESMIIKYEKEKAQRRFLFFWHDKLWKQFIAFDAENPAFAGKTFDDFAEAIQKRYGPSAMTFRKQRSSDDQTLDHLEWPPSGDYVLWAIDLTTFYGNFCLSLWQKSKFPDIEAGRKANSPERPISRANADEVLKPSNAKDDANADIIDQITGRGNEDVSGRKPAAAAHGKGKKGQKGQKGTEKQEEAEPAAPTTADPLEGTKF